jgi:hypothetical protein
MKHLLPLVLLTLGGCASAATMQQHREAKAMTRMEVLVPDSQSVVFGRAMSALLDEGYTVRTAERDAGLIVTAPKYTESSAAASFLIGGSGKRLLVLTVNALQLGDSTRAVISGTWQWENATNQFSRSEEPITAAHPEWPTIERIATAVRGISPAPSPQPEGSFRPSPDRG